MQYYLISMDNELVGKMYLTYDVNNDSEKWAWVSGIKFAYPFIDKRDAMMFANFLMLSWEEIELVPQQEDFAA